MSGLSVGVRVRVVRGGRVLATDVPVTGVKVEWSGARLVPGLLTYTAPLSWTPVEPTDPLARFGQRSLVDVILTDGVGCEVGAVPLGEWVHQSWVVGESGVTVTCHDLMSLLEGDPMGWPSSPASGTRVSREAQRLAGQVVTVLDAGVDDRLVPVTTQWSCSRSESLGALASSVGAGVRAGIDGCLHLYPLRDAAAPDLVLTPGTGLLDAPPVQGGDKRAPNRWIVTGTHREGEVEEQWTATRVNDVGPYDPRSYGWVTQHDEFSAAATRAAVEQAADTYMRQSLEAVVKRTVECVPDPRIEVGDVIGVVPLVGETFAGRVTGYTLPVSDVGAAMSVDLDVLNW